MGTSNYSNDFKRDAVHQITVRGYSVPNGRSVRITTLRSNRVGEK